MIIRMATPQRRPPINLETAVTRSFEQVTAAEFAGLAALAQFVARRIETSRHPPSAALVSAASNLDRAATANTPAGDDRERALDAAIAEILSTD
jgi:hypothetical protein